MSWDMVESLFNVVQAKTKELVSVAPIFFNYLR